MKKFIFSFLLFCIPLLFLLGVILSLPTTPRQRHSYTFASTLKDSLLIYTESPRIILLGGSNLAFGINSQMIKDSLNLNPVNMGLHAGIGLKYMLDSSLPLLRKDDIVIISPEYEQFANDLIYGSYPLVDVVFNVKQESIQKELKQKVYNLSDLNFSQYNQLIKYLPTNIAAKFNKREYSDTTFTSCYRYDAFNQFGDNICHWGDSINIEYIKPTQTSLDEINMNAFKILEDFCTKAQQRGIHVYMSFPPLYDKHIEHSEEYIQKVLDLVDEKNIKIIGDPYSYKVPLSDLYDTQYHLNGRGVYKRTKLFIKELKENES